MCTQTSRKSNHILKKKKKSGGGEGPIELKRKYLK